MDAKLVRIAKVLSALPEQMRVELAGQLLTSGFAIVPRNCNAAIEGSFKATARRLHSALRTDLKFNPLAISACWQAMVAEAESELQVDSADEETERQETGVPA
jgi:hypothetical protein